MFDQTVFRLDKNTVFAGLMAVSVAFGSAGFGVMWVWHAVGFRNEYMLVFVKLFDLSTDTSLPTWWAGFLHLVASLLLFVTFRLKQMEGDVFTWHWAGLAGLFFVFSVDEVAGIHENLGDFVANQTLGALTARFYYSWLAAGVAFAAVIGIIYLRFLIHLPAKTRNLFILAGVVFIGGALGMEMITSNYSEQHGSWNLTYAAITAVEEFMEMAGTSIFCYALLDALGLSRVTPALTLIRH